MDSDSNSDVDVADTVDDTHSSNVPLRLIENICSPDGRREASAAASSNYRQMQGFGEPSVSSNGTIAMPYTGYRVDGGELRIINRRREAGEPYRSRRMLNAENGHYEEGPNEDLFESGPSMARFT